MKNVSAPGSPTIADAETVVGDGTRFITSAGLHAYRFLIKGNGSIKIQAFDASNNQALAAPATFDTTEVHGGHTYLFGVS